MPFKKDYLTKYTELTCIGCWGMWYGWWGICGWLVIASFSSPVLPLFTIVFLFDDRWLWSGSRHSTVKIGNIKYNKRSIEYIRSRIEEGVTAQPWMLSSIDTKGKWKKNKMAFVEIKALIERKLAHLKRGYLTDNEVWEAAKELQNHVGKIHFF